MESFHGKLSHLTDETIKRIVMRLLIVKVFKEKFVLQRAQDVTMVYIEPGRKIENFKKGEIPIVMMAATDRQEEAQF